MECLQLLLLESIQGYSSSSQWRQFANIGSQQIAINSEYF